MRGEFLDLQGTHLYYYAAGSRGAGEPIVLLHGFPTSGHVWNAVVPLLPTGHRVVVLDLLGFGRSAPPGSAAVDLRAHADRVVAVLDLLGIDFACLVGHGIGGGIAQSVAVRHPGRISRLCLVNSVGFDAWPARAIRVARAVLPLARHLPPNWILSLIRGELLRGYVDAERGSHAVDLYLRPFADYGGRDAFVAHLAAMHSAETRALTPHLAGITCPTTIVWGGDDPFLSPAIGARLHKAIPHSTLRVLPDARHFVPEEAAHDVAGAVSEVLGRS